MLTRRTAIKITTATIAGLASGITPSNLMSATNRFVSLRPPLKSRKFVSDAVESTITSVQQIINDEELSWLFGNCFPNTLDTTVEAGERDGKPLERSYLYHSEIMTGGSVNFEMTDHPTQWGSSESNYPPSMSQ